MSPKLSPPHDEVSEEEEQAERSCDVLHETKMEDVGI